MIKDKIYFWSQFLVLLHRVVLTQFFFRCGIFCCANLNEYIELVRNMMNDSEYSYHTLDPEDITDLLKVVLNNNSETLH